MSEKNIFQSQYLETDVEVSGVEDLLEKIAEICLKNNICEDKTELIKKIKEREELTSTGFENGIAIPHTRFKDIKKSAVLFIRLKKGIDWKAMDGNVSDKFFCILVPENENVGDEHLKILGILANKLLDDKFINILSTEKNKNNLFKTINNIFNDEDKKETPKVVESTNSKKDFYVAVSACTFGLAHTYLAEQKLIKFAKENDFEIKVETHGARGDQNIITEEDLKKAKGVLIAVDKNLDLKHIKHENIYRTRTIDAIKNTDKCFEILKGNIKINKTKASIDNFFKLKLHQSASFAAGKTYNIIRLFALIIAIMVFAYKINDESKFLIDSLNLLKYLAIPGIPLIAAFLTFSFTKSEGTASAVGGSLFAITVYKNINYFNNDLIKPIASIGIMGAIIITLFAVLYHLYIYKLNSKIFAKNRKLNGGFKWFLQIMLVMLVLVIVFYSFDSISFANNFLFEHIIKLDNDHWWFRTIMATMFFALMVTDMGGPLNKWAITFSALFFIDSFAISPLNPWMTPLTAQVIAISTPGIAIWVRGLILKNKLTSKELELSKTAGKQGFNGISEGALWTLEKYKWKAYLSNYILALYCGFIIGIFHIQTFGGYNNILGVFFGFSTDNFLQLCGFDLPSFNIGFLILTLSSPIFGGIISTLALRNSNENKVKNEKRIQKI
ncbi:fructose PTS transporter subunit IIA [Spiroplasma alleghenense]|uniref:PTS system, fructose-specific IIA component n=1 Tax=Spiroplasma alleghenense TaxID=216931 RepID=A0A345Z307_9MOLU|nr:fructose PTS transporter subunit IIA [Spiroplasma alleghenense]AXK50986.1 PTS system, fructose-specific IIA component [Spiroplasma alleghenense]